jgi:broad specificity phosphatase PhoE
VRTLYLARHAEAQLEPGGKEGQLFSVGDWPLSARGRAQAEALRESLAKVSVDRVVASPLRRAQETAGIVAQPHGLPVRTEPGLAELPLAGNATTYEGVVANIRAVALALEQGREDCFPGGGSWRAERARILAALERAFDGAEHVLAVAHGGANRVILADALAIPPSHAFRLEQHHGCVNVLEWRGDRVRVRRINALPGALA